MDTLMMIVLTTMVVVLGVAMGAAVQKKTYFLYPVDAFTLLLFFFVGVQILAQYLPPLSVAYIGVDAYWYVPLVIGYIAGYIVSGRTRYIMIRCFNPDKSTYGEHWILYTKDGRTYRQEQSNRELFKRLLFHVEHEVVSNADLVPDWDDVTSYPLFPEFVRPTVVVESVDVSWVPEHWFWRFSVRRYTTRVDVAYAGTVSKMELAQDETALRVLQRQNTALVSELRDMRSRQGPALMEMALRMEQSIEATSPVNRMYDLLNAQQDGLKRKRKERRAEKRAQAKEEKEDGGEEDAAAEAQP